MRRMRWFKEWALYALYVGFGGDPYNPGHYSVAPPSRDILEGKS